MIDPNKHSENHNKENKTYDSDVPVQSLKTDISEIPKESKKKKTILFVAFFFCF